MTSRPNRSSLTISVEEILQGWRKTERGPKPRLSEIQLFAALFFIAEYGPLGRYDLATQIHENQGVVRGLLERLLQYRLIQSSKAGARVSPAGRKVLDAFLASHNIALLRRIEVPSLVDSRHTYGSLLRQIGGEALRVIEKRDIAVRMGARGALMLLCTKHGLTIPPDNESVSKLYPEAASVLEAVFPSSQGDVVFLAFAEDEYAALAGVMAVSLTLAV